MSLRSVSTISNVSSVSREHQPAACLVRNTKQSKQTTAGHHCCLAVPRAEPVWFALVVELGAAAFSRLRLVKDVPAAQVRVDGRLRRTVHGHPCARNIFVRESVAAGAAAGDADILFVDFGWAGLNKIVTYPTSMEVNTDGFQAPLSRRYQRWPEGVRPSEPISHALDKAVLEMSLHESSTHVHQAF